MKKCTACKQEKPLTNFHKNIKMRDGYLNRCKKCRREQSKVYMQTESGKKVRQRSRKTWRKRNPEKRKAHKLLENAIKGGRLKKSDYCELCDKDEQLHGHHHNYAWPLLVTWICLACHKLLHRKDT